jgi:glycosyltransferase involved in cell wall biosynthesis
MSHRTLILVQTYPGQPSCADLARQAAAGTRPRKDYVELARRLDADVVDSSYMRERAAPVARIVARRLGLSAGQVAEAFIRRGSYDHICAWAERIGLPLAFLRKIARVDGDLVLISSWLSARRSSFLLRQLSVHTHLERIVSYGSLQIEIAATRLGVPRGKLQLALSPVDENFWRPRPSALADSICAVGASGRDYETLFTALSGLDVDLDVAVGSGDRQARDLEASLKRSDVMANTRIRNLAPAELRDLYARSRFVVVPLLDVEYDAGVTALTEAMAMGKALIVTRTRGQVDLIEDGVQGIYVPAGDARAMRSAIQFLFSHPEVADRMGRAGRALVETRHTLDAYIERLANVVRGESVAA